MEFRKLRIKDLIPASYNPRKKLKPGDKEFEKIKNSITEFGYVEPIIVNSDMTIIGGHQRATVLQTLGYNEIDCIVIEIDKTKEKAEVLLDVPLESQFDSPSLENGCEVTSLSMLLSFYGYETTKNQLAEQLDYVPVFNADGTVALK